MKTILKAFCWTLRDGLNNGEIFMPILITLLSPLTLTILFLMWLINPEIIEQRADEL